jgi:Tfp pilus assembly protein PilF
MTPWLTDLLIGLALVTGAVVVYWPATGNDFVNYDDPAYVSENQQVLQGLSADRIRWAFTTTNAANYHPLTWLSLQVDASVFAPDPFGFHLTNLLLHALNTVLLFCFLRLATGQRWPGMLVAGLFALHPLHVESVAWVAERKDVLSGLFWMLTLLAYVWYVRRPRVGRYLVVAAALTLGLLAKPMLVTVPCVLLLLDYWPLRRAERPGRLVLEKLPLFLLVAGSCALTLYAQRAGGALSTLANLSLWQRLGNALIAYVVYLRKAIWPTDLAVYYPISFEPIHFLPLLGAALLLALVTWLCLKARRSCPYLVVGWFWYLGTLVPVIGLVQVGAQALADRYAYIPLIGLYIMLAWGGADLVKRFALPLPVAAGLGATALAMCTVGTRLQLTSWRNSITLWERQITIVPAHYYGPHQLATYFLQTGKQFENSGDLRTAQDFFHKAVQHYQAVVRLAPGLKLDWYNAALVLEHLGDLTQAEQHYRQALGLDSNWLLPQQGLLRLGQRRLKMAAALLHSGKAKEARDEYQKALRLDPQWLARCNRQAWVLATHPDPKKQDSAKALVLAEELCTATDYQQPQLLDTLAAAYAAAGRFSKAASTAGRALELARSAKLEALCSPLELRLKLYQGGQPYRDAVAP